VARAVLPEVCNNGEGILPAPPLPRSNYVKTNEIYLIKDLMVHDTRLGIAV